MEFPFKPKTQGQPIVRFMTFSIVQNSTSCIHVKVIVFSSRRRKAIRTIPFRRLVSEGAGPGSGRAVNREKLQ